MARLKVKPTFEEKDLGINPHIHHLEIPIVTRTIDDQFKIDSDGVKLPVEIQMEYTSHAKIYSTKNHRLIINRCSPAAKSLLLWLMYEIPTGKDYLWINHKRYMAETFTSLNTFKKAINELHRYCIITPTYIKKVYWINPHYFFKGSRVNKYPNNVKVVESKQKRVKTKSMFQIDETAPVREEL